MKARDRRDQLKTRIAPGIWVDQDGNPHFSIPELLVYFEMEDTPENREACETVVRKAIADEMPGVTIIELPRRGVAFSISNDGKSITCHNCMKTSYNPNDVANKYCGHCKAFHE